MIKLSTLLSLLFAIMIMDVFSQDLEKISCYYDGYVGYGYVDKSSHTIIIPCKYESAKDFSEGVAAVQPRYSRWGFIDTTGQVVIPFNFRRAGSFSEGLAAVKVKGKWGFIDKAGKEVVPFNYKDVGNFTGGYALVRYGNLWGAIDKNGTVIVPFNYDDMYSAHAAIERAVLEREKIALEREKVAKERERMTTQEQENRVTEDINPITTNTCDIILLQSGNEIKAKVLEITDQQIKYKDFDFQSGPTRNLNIFEVFMITYENGQKEVFNKKSPSSARENVTNCVKNTAFGLDIGIGGAEVSEIFSTALGIRVMHHFNPYFGIDFFKINWLTDYEVKGYGAGAWVMRIQIMPGFRLNSPTIFKCMSVYSAFRLGYGMLVGCDRVTGVMLGRSTNFEGLCLETELGVNATSAVFVGFAYNYHKYFGSFSGRNHTFTVRFGFNFGK